MATDAFDAARDALRLRLTGRLDLCRLAAGSGFSMPSQVLMLEVVRCTRLWRFEKVAVARAHLAFSGRPGSGATLEQLAGLFGELRMVAKLIRKAKNGSGDCGGGRCGG